MNTPTLIGSTEGVHFRANTSQYFHSWRSNPWEQHNLPTIHLSSLRPDKANKVIENFLQILPQLGYKNQWNKNINIHKIFTLGAQWSTLELNFVYSWGLIHILSFLLAKLCTTMKLTLYKAVIRLIICYGAPTCTACSTKAMEKLEEFAWRILRYCTGLSFLQLKDRKMRAQAKIYWRAKIKPYFDVVCGPVESSVSSS